MMWSDTARLYMGRNLRVRVGSGLGVGDDVAQRAVGSAGEPRERGWQVFERAGAGEQAVVHRVGEQFERERQAAAVAPSRALCRGYRADLRGAQRQTPGVE